MGCQYPSATPEQGGPPELDTTICERCHQTVPMYEFAMTMCLDCVQAAYEEHYS